MAGRKLARRGRKNGAGRNRTSYSRSRAGRRLMCSRWRPEQMVTNLVTNTRTLTTTCVVARGRSQQILKTNQHLWGLNSTRTDDFRRISTGGLTRGRLSDAPRVDFAVFMPYRQLAATALLTNSLILLARPTGIEPAFPP